MLDVTPSSGTFTGAGQDFLTLVDGGEDGQVVPLAPLVVKSRDLDVVIAIDAVSIFPQTPWPTHT
jgi:lysophospholipase